MKIQTRPQPRFVRMATLGGAEAIGLGEEIDQQAVTREVKKLSQRIAVSVHPQ